MKAKITTFFKENKTVLIFLFCFSFLVFGFFGISSIANNDGILDYIIDGSSSGATANVSIPMGRWGWQIISFIFDYYPLSFLCLFLNCFLFSISTIFLNKIFGIKNKTLQIIIGMILISFPINSYLYSYFAWQKSIGIGYLCSIYSVYLLKNSNKIYKYIISIILMTFSIGIYQIFLPYLVVLIMYLIILEVLENKKIKEIIQTIGKYVLCFALSCVLYVIITKLFTFIYGVEMLNYQYANSMFNIDLNVIFANFIPSFQQCFKINDLYFFPKISHYILIFFLGLSLISSFFTKISLKNKLLLFILFVFLMMTPQMIRFVKPYQWFHTLTLLPYVVLYAGSIPLLFSNLEKIIKSKKVLKLVNTTLLSILVIVSFSFTVNDNKAAVMAKNTSEAAFSFVNRLQMRIESTEGYEDLIGPRKYYFIGKYNFYEFPKSTRAYVNELGITTNFVFNPPNIVDAINVLGIEAVYYNKYISGSALEEEIINLSKDYKKYPSQNSIFIYNGIVVVILE